MDWTHIVIALIAGLPATIPALVAAILSLRNNTKIDIATKKVDENTQITTTAKVEAKEAAHDVAVSAANAAKEVANVASKKVTETMSEVKNVVNGRMDELIEAAKAKAYADGLKDGQKFAEEMTVAMKTNQQRIDALNLHNQRNLEAIAALKAMLEEVKKEQQAKAP